MVIYCFNAVYPVYLLQSVLSSSTVYLVSERKLFFYAHVISTEGRDLCFCSRFLSRSTLLK